MKSSKLLLLILVVVSFSSCYNHNQKADGPGANFIRLKEYAPAMYHSEPYEPLTQIKDTSGWLASGEWSGYTKEGYGEFYNSAPHYNKIGTNVLTPVQGTVRRVSNSNYEDITLKASSYPNTDAGRTKAGLELKNPIVIDKEWVVNAKGDSTLKMTKSGEALFKECKQLYTRICSHCHGKGGAGDGKVAAILKGVPVYQSDAKKNLSAGHIFHVITNGINRMGSHASQVSVEERWKIVTYVQYLQKQ